MKKLLLSLTLILSLNFSFGQNYYKAISTEMYVKNTTTDKWEVYSKNDDTNITIVIEDGVINIQAQSPTLYRIDSDDRDKIDSKSFYGYKYYATELKKDLKCYIDVVKHKTSKMYIISVYYNDINLRYVVEPIETN